MGASMVSRRTVSSRDRTAHNHKGSSGYSSDTIGNNMDVRTAIRNGDLSALQILLLEDASRANALIRWGANDRNLTHPLHFVSDMLYEGTLSKGLELPIINALIQSGADLDFQINQKGDTPLIGAAGLLAEDVGLKLLEAGANAQPRGIFGETALHWAAFLGEDRLAAKLIDCSDLNLRDEKYNSPPLGWAIHGFFNPPSGKRGRQCEVAGVLVAAGARVEPEWLQSEQVQGDLGMMTALSAQSPSKEQ